MANSTQKRTFLFPPPSSLRGKEELARVRIERPHADVSIAQLNSGFRTYIQQTTYVEVSTKGGQKYRFKISVCTNVILYKKITNTKRSIRICGFEHVCQERRITFSKGSFLIHSGKYVAIAKKKYIITKLKSVSCVEERQTYLLGIGIES